MTRETLKLSAQSTHIAALSVCEQLLEFCKNNSIKPTDVVGISRGGLYLAQYTAYAFEKQNLKCKVRTYSEVCRDKQRFLKRTLVICDDILDTGKTFDKVILEGFTDNLMATLVAKDIRQKDWLEYGKYFTSAKHRIISRNVWVKFPWDF